MWETGKEGCISDQQQGTAAHRTGQQGKQFMKGVEKAEATKVTTSFLQQHLGTHFLNTRVTSVEIPGRCKELEQRWSHDI